MEEQVSIIITILAALLTGGFLMIFIESQQVASNMAERFHFIMALSFIVSPTMQGLYPHSNLVSVSEG